MSFYEHFAHRPRNPIGRRVKRYQARRLFEAGLDGRGAGSASVLDVGPGDGYLADLARERGVRYEAVEGSPAVAAALRERGVPVHEAFVPPLPDGLERFDAIYLLHVIEHMSDMDRAVELVRGLRDHLLPGGRLVVATPDYNRWRKDFFDCDYTHHVPFTLRRLGKLLRDEGYRPVRETIYVGPIFSGLGLPLYWAARLLYPRFLDDLAYRYGSADLANRAFLTAIPNVLTVAVRDDGPGSDAPASGQGRSSTETSST